MFRESNLNVQSLAALLYFFLGPLLLFFVEFRAVYLVFFLIHFIWFGLSSSLFYHRVVTHRCAVLNPIVEFIFLLGGVISLSGSPIRWAAVHRFHHANPDVDVDPHSPLHGRFWSYMGWVYHQDLKVIDELKNENCKDLLARKLYRFFDHPLMITLPNSVYGLILFFCFDLGTAIWSLVIAGLFSYHCHWMLIASFCHSSNFGSRPFDTADESRNVTWFSLFSFGESLHNHHHYHQRSAKLTSSFWEFDFTYFVIVLFEKIGLARDVITIDFKSKKESLSCQ